MNITNQSNIDTFGLPHHRPKGLRFGTVSLKKHHHNIWEASFRFLDQKHRQPKPSDISLWGSSDDEVLAKTNTYLGTVVLHHEFQIV